MSVLLRSGFAALAMLALAAAPSFAQKKVKTETIREQETPPNKAKAGKQNAVVPVEVIRDLSRLPEPVRKRREEILAAARTGDLEKVAAIMKAQATPPVFTFGGDTDPVAFWRTTFPDSEGVEVLSTLIEVLESPFVQLDRGNASETYIWPYFHAVPLDKLTPAQRVELFRLVTAFDFKEMQKFGSYNFFRVGISPDGTWQFFVGGD
jgi:hypothetical protein